MANVEAPPKFMRPRPYAKRVGINWRSIYSYINKGALPATKFQGILLLDVQRCDDILAGLVRYGPYGPRKEKNPERVATGKKAAAAKIRNRKARLGLAEASAQ